VRCLGLAVARQEQQRAREPVPLPTGPALGAYDSSLRAIPVQRATKFQIFAIAAAAAAWRDRLLRAVAGKADQIHVKYGIRGERRLPELELPWLHGHEDSRPVRVGNAASAQHRPDVSWRGARRDAPDVAHGRPAGREGLACEDGATDAPRIHVAGEGRPTVSKSSAYRPAGYQRAGYLSTRERHTLSVCRSGGA
jgi:hypothetical protein